MSDREYVLKEKCGVFGVYGSGPASVLTFYGLWALQHRGQDSSGIASSDGEFLYSHAGDGLVAHVYDEDVLKGLRGSMAIGHNRYCTSGVRENSYKQPIVKSKSNFAFAHNGNLPSTVALEEFLGGVGDSENDSGMMALAIDHYVSLGATLPEAIVASYPLFTGAFSCVAMDLNSIVAFRDSCGIRPLSIGKLSDGFVVASETCALDTVGATFLRDVAPGEMVVIDKNGVGSTQVASGSARLDIFEFVYFSRPDSLLLGKRVNEVRRNLGRELAGECSIKADIVIPVPDSAIPAALGFAEVSGIPFDHGLIKNRYIHRTFIQPTSETRERDVRMKLNPLPESIRGRRVVLVDDSIVRGTTMKKLVNLIYSAGARTVDVVISSPPVKYPDFYGINTPIQEELIAARLNNSEIRDYIGSDSLSYLSYGGMIRATGLSEGLFSTSCFTGDYPIDILEKKLEVSL